MRRTFEYDLPEGVEQGTPLAAAIGTILQQHTTFVEGQFAHHIAPEDLQTQIQQGFTTLQAEEATRAEATNTRNALITRHLPTTLVEGAAPDLIQAANITPEDDETTIETKLKEAFDKRPHLHADNFFKKGIIRKDLNKKPEKKYKWSKIKR